jgi:DNA-binding IclR family transcriptional regulator
VPERALWSARVAPLTRTQRALLVLEHLATTDSPPTHGELVRALDIHRSTLSEVLADLRRMGYVAVVDRRYVLGSQMLSLVHRAGSHRDRHAWIRPLLGRLARATNETAVYVVEVGDSIIPVDQVESAQAIRYAAALGEPRPIYRAAAGLVLMAFTGRTSADLAHLPPDVDRSWLDAELERVHTRGYAFHVPDAPTRSIAAPLRDPTGRVVGAVAVLGPPGRFDHPITAWPALQAALADYEEPEPAIAL